MTEIILQSGKYYSNRNGAVHGPMADRRAGTYPMEARGFGWTRKGEYYSDAVTPLDLITECTADGSPIQPKPSKREAIAALESAVLSLQARIDVLEAAAVKPGRRVTGWYVVQSAGFLFGPFDTKGKAQLVGNGWPVYIDATEGDEPADGDES